MWHYVKMQHDADWQIEKNFEHDFACGMFGQVHSRHGKKRLTVAVCDTVRVSSPRISNVISQKADETITWLRYGHRTH
jgi:hypothetical protein